MGKSKLTKEQLIAELEVGLSRIEIAKKYNIRPQGIYLKCRLLNLKVPNWRATEKGREWCRQVGLKHLLTPESKNLFMQRMHTVKRTEACKQAVKAYFKNPKNNLKLRLTQTELNDYTLLQKKGYSSSEAYGIIGRFDIKEEWDKRKKASPKDWPVRLPDSGGRRPSGFVGAYRTACHLDAATTRHKSIARIWPP